MNSIPLCKSIVASFVLVNAVAFAQDETKDQSAAADERAAINESAAESEQAEPRESENDADDAAGEQTDGIQPTDSVKPAVVAPAAVKPEWLEAVQWRSIGPASMGGRIVDLEVVESDPSIFYVATASGGLFKTINNGTTFTAHFDHERTVSIGDVAVSASDPNIVWVGTGEHNARNSVSWGDGVYRSMDSGKSWEHMGLKESFQIGRIAIHPTNPDVVYVGALGRLWGTNPERGVFRTIDGGKTWKKILFIDERTGCIDIAMHPRDPDTLMVAMYERQRDRYSSNDPIKRWGPGSGLYKTTDGGANWKRLTKGLPDVELGRIGVKWYAGAPNTVYAVVESELIGDGPASAFMGITGGQRVPDALIQQVTEGGPAQKAGMLGGDVVLSVDGKDTKTYNDLVLAIRSHKPEEVSKLVVQRGDDELELEITWGERPGGERPFSSYLGGQRANAIEQQGENGWKTGGIYKSTDGGESWNRINSLNPRPFYYSQMHVDPSDDSYLYVPGVSFHYSTDGGREFRTGADRVHPDHHALWIDPKDGRHLILGCDGGLYISYDRGATWSFHDIMPIGQFYDVGVDLKQPYTVYGGLQDNGSWGAVSRTRGNSGPDNADWLRIGGGDGFVCRVDPEDNDVVYYESQGGNMSRLNVNTHERTRIRPVAEKDLTYRFNWKTPFQLSHHNSRIFYCAGNYVFRSLDRGKDLKRISPKITSTDRGSGTAFSESPLNADVLYAGTDDGQLWVTTDGGVNWENATSRLGLDGEYHVHAIEASRFEPGRVYVAFDGHTLDSDAPHLRVSEDFGQTWTSLDGDLPAGSTRCLREDAENPELLYCGTEFALFASFDRGQHWLPLNSNLPTVAIHEIAVHPTAGEIVAATHGRSVWILDVASLRQMNSELLAKEAHLFAPKPAVKWSGQLSFNRSGNQIYTGSNPEFGATLSYYLRDPVEKATLEILDIRGATIRELPIKPEAGLHHIRWDLRKAGQPPRGQTTRRTPLGSAVDPGVYLVRLTVGETAHDQPLTVNADPDRPLAALQEELEEFDAKQRPSFDE